MLAENYYRQGEYEKATQIYKNLYDKNQYNTTYLARLVSCYQETNKFSVAENLLRKKLQKNPNLGYTYVLLGYNFQRQKKDKEAVNWYKKAISFIDKKPNYGGIIGRLFKEYNLLDLAIAAYTKAMQKNSATHFEFIIAQIYGEKGDFKKMFTSYLNLVDKNESYLETVQRYASRYITNDALHDINVQFKKALLRKSASNPKNVWNRLLSWLFIQQKEYSKALLQEKALFARDPNYLSNIVELGNVAFENSNFNTAKECYNFVLEHTNFIKDKLFAHQQIIKIAIQQKNPDIQSLFAQIFNKYGKSQNTLQLQTLYADYLTFQKNKPKEANKILEEALRLARSKYEKARIKLKLADVLVFTGKFNKALIYFSQVQTRLKGHPLAQEARFKVAQTSYFKGDFSWAKAQLKVLKGSATQLIANDAADLYITITDNEPVDSIPSGLKQYAEADLLAFQHKNNKAISILQDIVVKYKGQPIEDEAFYKQAELYIKEQQLEKAITNFTKVLAMDAQGVLADNCVYQLAELYNNKLNNSTKASEYYKKIIFDYPSSIYLVDARKKFRKLRGDSI